MRLRSWLVAALLASGGSVAAQPRAAQGAPDVRRAPVTREHQYTLNARVRPMLFWIRRPDVGEARLVWRRDQDAYGFELLVGSDPLKAPRHINKWGYLAEDVSGSDATTFGVMKQGRARTVAEAESQIARDGVDGYVFQAVRAHMTSGGCDTVSIRIRSATDLTLRDLDALLARVSGEAPQPRPCAVLPRTAPGFLCALAALLDETLAAAKPDRARPAPRLYLYNGKVYDLKVRAMRTRADFAAGQRRYGPAIEGEFEVVNRATREATPFSMVYGRTGELAGVPLRIVFRPNWWFEAELLLDQAPAATGE